MGNTFWMVWRENGGAPTYKHDFEDAARQEAARLARTNRGQRFYVLRVVDAVTEPLPPLQWENSPVGSVSTVEQPPY